MFSNLISFAVVAALLTMLPGIDTAQVLRSVAIGGKRMAYSTLLGIFTAIWFWGVSAALGISALLLASERAYTILRVTGAIYLLYLGIKMIWQSRHISSASVTDRSNTAPSFWAAFSRAFLITFTNPKAGVFYIAVLPGFMPHNMPAALGGLLLSSIHNFLALIWFSLMIFGASFAKETLSNFKVLKNIERISGAALIGFGIKVALE